MQLSLRNIIVLASCWCLPSLAHCDVTDQHAVAQYRATMVRLFLQTYRAFPIFIQNPIFPGSLISAQYETIDLAPDRCYDAQNVKYVRLSDLGAGASVTTNADLKVGANILSGLIAKAEAGAGVSFSNEAVLSVSPLSNASFRPDMAALRSPKPGPLCDPVRDVLAGHGAGKILVARVYHGTVTYGLTARFKGNVDANARTSGKVVVAKVFNIKEAGISASSDTMTFAVARSPGEVTLAVTPVALSYEKLVRITQYLQGKRGVDLERAVNDVLHTDNESLLQQSIDTIKLVFAELSGGVSANEDWARSFVEGEKMIPTDLLVDAEKLGVNMQAVANYAAAMEILRVDRENPERKISLERNAAINQQR
jgi:hypothetical protein